MKSGNTGIKTRSTNLSTMFWNTSSNLSIYSDLTHAVESPSITANTNADITLITGGISRLNNMGGMSFRSSEAV